MLPFAFERTYPSPSSNINDHEELLSQIFLLILENERLAKNHNTQPAANK